ncbi:MAG: hypothetical protein RPU64_02045 [Candidatus Sedimenticola sp. (ex Thyasira tokunagai)]
MEMDNTQVAITASQSSDTLFFVIIVALLGVLIIVGIVAFAMRTLSRGHSAFPDYELYLEFLQEKNVRANIPRYLNEAFAEYLQRRNEFWTTYGQVVIAAFIIVILAILLLTKTISAEAGLPILSAVSGFAIAKGVSSSRTPSSPDDKNNMG